MKGEGVFCAETHYFRGSLFTARLSSLSVFEPRMRSMIITETGSPFTAILKREASGGGPDREIKTSRSPWKRCRQIAEVFIGLEMKRDNGAKF